MAVDDLEAPAAREYRSARAGDLLSIIVNRDDIVVLGC
jgi:hypothetical protein